MQNSPKDVISGLNWRYAVKSFSDTKIPSEVLEVLIESVRLSPSSFGLQPWKLLVITNDDIKAELRPHSWNQPQITECDALFVLCRKKNIDESMVNAHIVNMAKEGKITVETLEPLKQMMLGFMGQMSANELQNWAGKQLYIALGMLMSACMQLQVDSCPIEGFIAEKYNEILDLDAKNLHAQVICAVGYRNPADKQAARPKVRFDLDDVVEVMD